MIHLLDRDVPYSGSNNSDSLNYRWSQLVWQKFENLEQLLHICVFFSNHFFCFHFNNRVNFKSPYIVYSIIQNDPHSALYYITPEDFLNEKVDEILNTR